MTIFAFASTFTSTQPFHQFRLNVAGKEQTVEVGNRTLAKTLASDDEDSAVEKMRARDVCRDWAIDFFSLARFGLTKKEDVIRALWKVANPDTSKGLQNGVLYLMQHAEDPRKLAESFSAEEGKDENKSPTLTIRVAGQKESTVSFDTLPTWDPFYFSKDDDKPIWRLSERAVQLAQVANSPTSVDFQANLIACLANYPDQINDLFIEKTEIQDQQTQQQRTVLKFSLFGKPVAMTFDGKVNLDPVIFQDSIGCGVFQVNPIAFGTYHPIFDALYNSENGEQSLADALLGDKAIKNSANIKEMKEGENLSYQSATFRQQVCRDLPRQRFNLDPDAEHQFTQQVIQLFAPHLLTQLEESANLIYQDFRKVPMALGEGKNERRLLLQLLEQVQPSSTQTDFSDQPHAKIIQDFLTLSEKQQQAFLKLARLNVDFQFKSEELNTQSSEFLSELAQIASQGTLVAAAEMVKAVATMFNAKDGDLSLVQNQFKQHIAQTNKSESMSELTHSWPVNVRQRVIEGDSFKIKEWPILELSTQFEFETSHPEKTPAYLKSVDEQVNLSKSQIDTLTQEIAAIDLEKSNQEKIKEDKKEEKQRLYSLTQTASPKKVRKMDLEKVVTESPALKDKHAATMKLTNYNVKIKLAYPEVANSAPRTFDEDGSSTSLTTPEWTVDSNLPVSRNLHRETAEKEHQKKVQIEAENEMADKMLGLYYAAYY